MRREPLLRDPLLLPFLAAVLVALFLAWHVLPFAPKPTGAWRGYYTLLLAMGPDLEEKASMLSTRLPEGSRIVSRYSAPVSYTDFEGPTRCVIAELPRRLDSMDPRFDPYLKGIEGYFHAPGWEILYIPSSRNVLSLIVRLLSILGPPGPFSWRLADVDLVVGLLAAFAMLGLSVLVALSMERRDVELVLPLFLNALFWMPAVLACGPAAFCLFSLLLVLWFPLLSECTHYARETILHNHTWKDPSRRETAGSLMDFLMPSVLLLFLYGLTVGAPSPGVYPLVVAALSSLVLLLLPFPINALRRKMRRGRLPFEPVAIVDGDRAPLRHRGALLTSAVLSSIALFSLSMARNAPLPEPETAPWVPAFSWEFLEGRPSDHHTGDLPDLADAVRHAAYQDGLAFGRSYGLPARDERVLVKEFVWNPQARKIVALERTVVVYDSIWLRSVVGRAAPGSVERMLLDQGSLSGVSLRAPASRAFRHAPFMAICLSALAAFLCAGARIGPLISGNLWRFNRRS